MIPVLKVYTAALVHTFRKQAWLRVIKGDAATRAPLTLFTVFFVFEFIIYLAFSSILQELLWLLFPEANRSSFFYDVKRSQNNVLASLYRFFNTIWLSCNRHCIATVKFTTGFTFGELWRRPSYQCAKTQIPVMGFRFHKQVAYWRHNQNEHNIVTQRTIQHWTLVD